MIVLAALFFAFVAGTCFGAVVFQRKPKPLALTDEMENEFRDYIQGVKGQHALPAADALLARLHERRALTPATRKTLEGERLDQFWVEWTEATTREESVVLVKRWHRNGYLFPHSVRLRLLHEAQGRVIRELLGQLFDRQDKGRT